MDCLCMWVCVNVCVCMPIGHMSMFTHRQTGDKPKKPKKAGISPFEGVINFIPVWRLLQVCVCVCVCVCVREYEWASCLNIIWIIYNVHYIYTPSRQGAFIIVYLPRCIVCMHVTFLYWGRFYIRQLQPFYRLLTLYNFVRILYTLYVELVFLDFLLFLPCQFVVFMKC